MNSIDLQERLGLSMLFISHDLGVIRYVCRRVAVMYLGRIVEIGPVDEILSHPQHPYTQLLLSAVPSLDPGRRHRHRVPVGELPSPLDPPAGCRFHTRCPHRMPACSRQDPVLHGVAPGHAVACHLHGAPAGTASEEERTAPTREVRS